MFESEVSGPAPAGGTPPASTAGAGATVPSPWCAAPPAAGADPCTTGDDGATGTGTGTGTGVGGAGCCLRAALPPVQECDADACLTLLQTVKRQKAWLDAVMIRTQARFAALRHTPDHEKGPAGETYAAEEIAAALDLSSAAARTQLELAETLTGRLPATLTALEAGVIDLGRARAAVDATANLSDAKAAAVEAKVLTRGGRGSHSLFRQALRRAVLTVDPDGARRRHDQARTDRRVALTPDEDGMSQLWALLPAADAQAAYQRIDLLARRAGSGEDDGNGEGDGEDPRGMDERRADVLTDLLLGRDRGARVRVEIGVIVPLATLAGVADTPGELAGYGPIPAATARELAAHATWRRILTDPVTGRPVEVGRRFPSPGLARFIQARDRTCRFPGCRKPASFCDLDHVRPHAEGGATEEGNLIAACRRHHRAKHRGGWKVEQAPDGTVVWTSPTGRVYRTVPEPWDDLDRPPSGTIQSGSPPAASGSAAVSAPGAGAAAAAGSAVAGSAPGSAVAAAAPNATSGTSPDAASGTSPDGASGTSPDGALGSGPEPGARSQQHPVPRQRCEANTSGTHTPSWRTGHTPGVGGTEPDTVPDLDPPPF